MELLGKHVRQMDVLGEVEGEDYDEVRVCRLAMLTRGEDPTDDVRVRQLLDLPLTEYQDYVDEVLTQRDAGALPIPQMDGSYHVPLKSGDTATVRPLLGRHRRLLGRLDDATGDRLLMTAMSDVAEAAIDPLPLGDYQAIMTAVDFLFQPVLERLMRTPSPGTGSSSPSGEC